MVSVIVMGWDGDYLNLAQLFRITFHIKVAYGNHHSLALFNVTK